MKRSRLSLRFLCVLSVFASSVLISSCKKSGPQSVSVRIGNIIVADRNLGVDVPKGGVALNYTNDTTHTDHKNSLFKGDYYTWEEAVTACPSGWRLPTKYELELIESKIKISNGQIYLKGANGHRCYFPLSSISTYPSGESMVYWSSTENDNDNDDLDLDFGAWYLYVTTGNNLGMESYVGSTARSSKLGTNASYTVRCVKTVE